MFSMAFTTRLAAAAVLLPQLLGPALAQDDIEAVFTYPSEDDGRLEFYDNTEVIVAFECPKDTVDLRIYCNDEEIEDYIHEVTVFEDVPCADQEYSFRVDFDYYSSSCWFNMRDNDGSGDVETNSPEFELSQTPADATFGPAQPVASVTTSLAPSSTESSEPTSTAGSDVSESTTAAASPSPDPENADSDNSGSDNPDSSLSTGAKAGIGVGISLGVIGLAALGGAFWLVKRKRGGSRDAPHSPGDRQELYAEPAGYKQPGYQMQEYYGGEGFKSGSNGPPSELADTRRPQYELTG